MTDEHKNAIEIAVVKEQIFGLREQAKQHAESTSARFDKLEENNAEQFERLDNKVDELLAVMNKGKGAYAVSLAVAGTIGAAIIGAVNYIISKLIA